MTVSRLRLIVPKADFSGVGLGAAKTLWTPAQLGALVLGWFDADDPTTLTKDGSGNVTAWASKANSFSVSKVAGAAAPVYSATGWGDGSAALTFAWGAGITGGWLCSGAGVGPTNDAGVCIFAAVKRLAQTTANASDYRRTIASVPGPLYNSVRQIAPIGFWDPVKDSGATIVFAGQHNSAVASNSQASPLAVGSKGLVSGEFGTATPFVAARLNGGSLGTSAPFYDVANSFGWNIGAGDNTNNSAVAAVIKEIIVTKYGLTTAQRQSIEGYMAWKAGIQSQLASGHPYTSDGPYV